MCFLQDPLRRIPHEKLQTIKHRQPNLKKNVTLAVDSPIVGDSMFCIPENFPKLE